MPEKQDPLLRKIKIRNWLAVGLMTAISLVFQSVPITLGIFLGGCICSLNFHWMYRDARRSLEGASDRAPRRMVGLFYLRLVVTGVVLYVIITQTPVNIIALVVGLSIVIMAIVFTLLLETQKKNFPRRLNNSHASSIFIP